MMRHESRVLGGRWVRTGRLVLSLVAISALVLPGCSLGKADSVKPGINDPYKNMTDVDTWTQRFEVEAREIYRERMQIMAQLDVKPGMHVADVGAGTGLFVEPLSRAIGATGKLYAVDIVPKFIEHINERVKETGLTNVETVQCKEDSVELPPASIDFAFICDTYHHFEYPSGTMTSLYKALRPGGEVVIVDFDRIEGRSREWILGHVRADKETVIKELRSFGFGLTDHQPTDDFLDENYIIRVRKME